MKVRTIILTIAAAAVLAAPASSLAQGGPGGGFGPHGGYGDGHGLGFSERMLPRMAERLDLSGTQVEQIQTILDEARPTIEGFAEQLRTGREEYRASIQDPTMFDEVAFRAHADAQHDIQTELGVAVGQTRARVLQVLTGEQLAEFQEMRENSGGDFKRRRSGGRRGH